MRIVFLACMHFSFLTLFPNFFASPLSESILKKAQEKKVFSYDTINIRDFSPNANKSVDEPPYGGMSGMLLQAEPVFRAIEHAQKKHPNSEVIFFSPTGKPFTQTVANRLAWNTKDKIFLCGHYEGIDQRVIDLMADEIYCVGSAVVTGGEIPSLYALDAIVRLLPNAIGKTMSHIEESFSVQFFGKGEYPQYTRPEVWKNLRVPSVLLSGNHAEIEQWKLENLQGLTSRERQILRLKTKIFSSEKIIKYRYFSLRLPKISDADVWFEEFSDTEVTQYLRAENTSMAAAIEFLQNDAIDLQSITLSAVDMKTKQVFANASLSFSEHASHIASFGIVLRKSHWGKGLGTHLTKKMCEIAFEFFPDIQKIQLEVFPENQAAIRVYEKVGFEKVGVLKKHQLKNGVLRDIVLYELMR